MWAQEWGDLVCEWDYWWWKRDPKLDLWLCPCGFEAPQDGGSVRRGRLWGRTLRGWRNGQTEETEAGKACWAEVHSSGFLGKASGLGAVRQSEKARLFLPTLRYLEFRWMRLLPLILKQVSPREEKTCKGRGKVLGYFSMGCEWWDAR